MNDNAVFFEGNLTRDTEMQFSKAGNGYSRNAIAVERRKKDGDEWVSETSFFDFSILDERLAENFCESFNKGDRVLVFGHLQTRTVEDDEGNKRTFTGLIVDNVGASVKWATVMITKNEKKGSNSAPAAGDDFFDN